ncbi:hypothetical protein [Providencia sp. PROV212]|uniref:hypothetical protein n=1 Tax=Providencia sp. PROV212 TaxID=2949909 RepID=UPI002349150C|nr:hypothetical protein [Providencia sp. PROV212]
MKKSSNLNVGTTLSVIVLIILILLVQLFKHEMKDYIKCILESDIISFFIWAYVITIFSIHHYLYSANELSSDGFLYKHFGSYAETVFSIATYGIAGTTSITLLRGLYLQTFYDGRYFTGFGSFDISSMFLLTTFLLIYCILNTTFLLKKILFHSKTATIVVKK